MRKTKIALPVLGLISATRGILGAGIGLLLAPKLRKNSRKAVGWTLFTVGVVTTLPLVIDGAGWKQRRKRAAIKVRGRSYLKDSDR